MNQLIPVNPTLNNQISHDKIYETLRSIMINAQKKIITSVNQELVYAYWEIGKEIYLNSGENNRAPYGKDLLQFISKRLTSEFGRGFDIRNLRHMRKFYRIFNDKSMLRPNLSWTHYRLLIKIPDQDARIFYLEESVKSGWSSRQLARQIDTLYYHRLKSTQLTAQIKYEHPELPANIDNAANFIKDPYVLDFTEISSPYFLEADLEQALIDHLECFLMELGRGFSLVARQQHINIKGHHFYIDLVFYNRFLKCFFLIDLKATELTHQDIGQMQMYVNYYTRELKEPDENPPIGLLLCTSKEAAIVEYTLPEDNHQIYVAKYHSFLPSKEELLNEINKYYYTEIYKDSHSE